MLLAFLAGTFAGQLLAVASYATGRLIQRHRTIRRLKLVPHGRDAID
jgi:hypothetical protein